MLLFPNTRIELSDERALAPGVSLEAEGLALVASYTAGVFGLKPSAGTAGEVFVGVSLSRPIAPTHVPVIQKLTVPASGKVNLKAPPLAGSLRVVNDATNVAYTVVAGNPAAATEVQNDGTGELEFQTGQAGVVVRVTYVRALTVAQAIMLQGNNDIGGPAGAYFGQSGFITRGDVYTTEFDTLADWQGDASDLRLGANGKFTLGGAGAKVPGYVVSIPSEGQAFLGLHINAN